MQAGFATKNGIVFPLVSDADRSIGEAYGVLKDNASRSAERTTFVIGRDGVVAKVYAKAKAAGHAAKVLGDVQELKAAGAL